MKKNKFLYMLSAFALACIISFSGVGGSYIQAKASSGITDILWNDNASAWENISRHALLWSNWAGAFIEPSLVGELFAVGNSAEFAAYMITEGYTEEQAEETVHGGGGHVRDGISMDDSGNVTYSDEVSDLFHGYIVNYLETECGYIVFESMTVDDLPESFWSTKPEHQNVKENLRKTIDNLGGYLFASINLAQNRVTLYQMNSCNFWSSAVANDSFTFDQAVNIASNLNNDPKVYLYNWYTYTDGNVYSKLLSGALSKSDYSGVEGNGVQANIYYPVNATQCYVVLTNDGRLCKVYPSLDAFRNHNHTQQPYYYTQNWVNYDASQDNSVTITNSQYQYYSDNSTTIYQNIQNNIDNGGDVLTEQDIQKIVEDTVKNVLDNIPSGGGSDNGDSGNNDNDDNGGTGIGTLFEGIGKFFDTILTLIGKLMGVVADFTQSILDLFSGFTTFTDGFSGFLAGAFGFIPQEIWNVIQVGLSLMILLAVIKFLRK